MKTCCSFWSFVLWASSLNVHAFAPNQSPERRISSTSLGSVADLGKVSIESYEYDGWNLRYRYKAASPGFEKESPLLLVHPVGIGLSSWFWEPLLEAWHGPEIFAPNLIGCGVSEGGDAWNPDERGLSFPLGWVKGCEAVMKTAANREIIPPFLNMNKKKWTVVTQGGLAPVGVMLASRNVDSIGKLVMSAPPTWKAMTTPVPESELLRNYNFLRSPLLGKLAFNILESRKLIEFFSNQFLFSKPCDSLWLDNTENELGEKSRPPVMAFNAGLCLHRTFEEELRTISQPTLILAGEDDKRQRSEYTQFMTNCQVRRIPGLAVLPWESPGDFAKILMNKI